MKVEYHHNNSGGSYWLTDENWLALSGAGWTLDKPYATIEDLTLGEAIASWEAATGLSSNALGCSCCGPPHGFTFEGNSGEHRYWTPRGSGLGEAYSETSR